MSQYGNARPIRGRVSCAIQAMEIQCIRLRHDAAQGSAHAEESEAARRKFAEKTLLQIRGFLQLFGDHFAGSMEVPGSRKNPHLARVASFG